MNVLLLSYETFNNVGEELLGDTTEFLLHSEANVMVERAQLVPSYAEACKYNRFAWVGMPLQYVALKMNNKNVFVHRLWELVYRIRLNAYYKKIIKKTDKIVIAVGMLKYKNQNFSYIFRIICKLATKYNKDVLFNAMSVASPDNSDVRFRQLVEAINMPCVRGVSTRDGEDGLEILRKYYISRENIILDDVGDPALWTPQTYQIKKRSDSSLIGINVIDPNIYTRYNYEFFTCDQVEKMYKEIIILMSKKRYEWVLFCNGMSGDYAFGKKLIKELNLPPNKLLSCPKNSSEYLGQIINFKAIFGARLHADISSMALDIPFVGIMWDSKLKYFGSTMEVSHFFVNCSDLNGETIVERLEEAMKYTYKYNARNYYKEKTKQFLKSFVISSTC